jgi:8-oxo-dGTP pyrophosphatase MutT (NUDIX family)
MESSKNFVLKDVKHNYKGKFLIHASKEYCLSDDPNKIINWECCFRNVKNPNRITGVEVIPLVKSQGKENKVLIIENFRYPVEKKVLEFPAGIIEDEEIPEGIIDDKAFEEVIIKAGKRELYEETGYTGEFVSFYSLPGMNSVKTFENLFFDPWKSSENSAILIFHINKNLEENLHPLQDLELEENIKVHEVELNNLINFIDEKVNKENYACCMNLYHFAMALRLNEVLKI